MNKYVRNLLVGTLILVAVFYFMLPLYHEHLPSQEISYSDFLDEARSGQIIQVTVDDGAVSGQRKDDRSFRVYVPTGDTSYIDLRSLRASRSRSSRRRDRRCGPPC